MLGAAFPKAKIYPLPDIGVGNNCKWGEYVIKNVEDIFGKKPDALFSGEEDRRTAWLNDELGIKEVFVPKTIKVSTTKLKKYLIYGDKKSWNKYIVATLRPKFDEIRRKIVETKNITNTQSI